MPYSIKTQDLPSLFASKNHALLCRNYIKGRDWYDFVWYVSRKTSINFLLLSNSLKQTGPWKDQNISVTPKWLLQKLKEKINSIDWDDTKKDVARFLKPRELTTLDVWSKKFFLSRLDKIEEYLKN